VKEVTRIEGAKIIIPKGGVMPVFGDSLVSGCYITSEEERLRWVCKDTMFKQCIFDGPIPDFEGSTSTDFGFDTCKYTDRSIKGG